MRGSTHTLLMDKRPFHPPTFFMMGSIHVVEE